MSAAKFAAALLSEPETDAKVISALADMTRGELCKVLNDIGAVFSHTERTSTLRTYIHEEYVAGRITADHILSIYPGGL